MTFYDAKKAAKAVLKNNLGEAILVSLIYSIALSILASVAGIGALLFGSLALICYYYCLIQASINNKFKIDDLFKPIDGTSLGSRIALSVLKNLYLSLWSLLFIIPGIIKSYSYMLAELISLQHPEMTASECITESRRLMDGHKMNMFVLRLSFIGWDLLCILTFGIGYIFLNPYIQQTNIEYINANIMPLKDVQTVVEEQK